jgi:hypothetical protein
MIFKNKNDIKNQIKKDWYLDEIYDQSSSNSNLIYSICMKILEYLEGTDLLTICHISIGSFRQIISTTELEEIADNGLILLALQYLSGDKVHLLDIKFEFINEDDESYEVSKSELSHAKAVGSLVHPETGETICDFEEKVFIYFQPSSLAKAYLS